MRAGVVLGCAALLAAGGVAAAFVLRGQVVPPQVVAPPAPAPAAPQPSQPAQATPDAVDFKPLVQSFSLKRDSAAYVAASLDSPQLYALKAGTSLVSASQSVDGAWIISLTADGRAAFIRSDDLGPYRPGQEPQPVQASTLSGPAKVVDTGQLIVGGQAVSLVGVVGHGGAYAAQFQSMIDANGSNVTCVPAASGAYTCTLPSGLDLARSALFNGAAEPAEDASPDYREQASAAQAAHKGIWRR